MPTRWQVNLAPLLPNATLDVMARTGVAAEFYISPPSWGRPPTEAGFRPFAIPLVEVRRRISATLRRRPKAAFFVRYRVLAATRSGGNAMREYRRRNGQRTAGSDPKLEESLPWLRAALHRFRTFDSQYAPCRH